MIDIDAIKKHVVAQVMAPPFATATEVFQDLPEPKEPEKVVPENTFDSNFILALMTMQTPEDYAAAYAAGERYLRRMGLYALVQTRSSAKE